jgi:uncharacterized membrane protein HdeD (DUF308 family)
MTALEGGLKRAFESSVVLAVLLIVFGVFAVILPIVSSIGITILIGWLVVFAGIARLGHAFQSENVDQTLWMLMLSIYYLTAGAYLLMGPDLGVVGLTLVLGIFLAAEGVANLIAYFSTRNRGGSKWMLLDGVVPLMGAAMIWDRWPLSSAWVIGTLVGISMATTGMTRLMTILAARSLASHPVGNSFRERAA